MVRFKPAPTLQDALTSILIIMTLAITPLTTTNTITAFADEKENASDDDKLGKIFKLASSAKNGEDALVEIENDEELEKQLGMSREELGDLIEDTNLFKGETLDVAVVGDDTCPIFGPIIRDGDFSPIILGCPIIIILPPRIPNPN
jgi:hypothetical protein